MLPMKSPAHKHHKCPYISPALNCLSTGYGTLQCMDYRFHTKCEHRMLADAVMRKEPLEDESDVIDVSLLDNAAAPKKKSK